MTAAERADLLTARLKRLADAPAASAPDAVQVSSLPSGDAVLSFAGTPVLTVTVADAKAAGLAAPFLLAGSWAKNLRAALPPPVAVLPSAPVGQPPSAAALPPTLVPPPTAETAPATEGATSVAPKTP